MNSTTSTLSADSSLATADPARKNPLQRVLKWTHHSMALVGAGAIAGAALPYHIPTDRLPFGIGDGVHITCRSEHRTVINRSRTRHPSTAENRSHAQCATDQCGATSHLRIPFIQSATMGIPFPY